MNGFCLAFRQSETEGGALENAHLSTQNGSGVGSACPAASGHSLIRNVILSNWKNQRAVCAISTLPGLLRTRLCCLLALLLGSEPELVKLGASPLVTVVEVRLQILIFLGRE